MGEIAIALLRGFGYPFLRHQSALGNAIWISALLVVAAVVYVVVGGLHNRRPREPGRHERTESLPQRSGTN